MVKRTLESTPKNATHWSTRAMAKELGLSQSTVSRIWRAFGLQPHRTETFNRTSATGSPHGTPTRKPYVWTKTADEILEGPASYLNRIPDSED